VENPRDIGRNAKENWWKPQEVLWKSRGELSGEPQEVLWKSRGELSREPQEVSRRNIERNWWKPKKYQGKRENFGWDCGKILEKSKKRIRKKLENGENRYGR
jgi:hypothetical protein